MGEEEVLPHFSRCKWAFGKYNFPASWDTIHSNPDFFEEAPDSSSAEESSSVSPADTSEEEPEKAPAPAVQPAAAASSSTP